MEALPILGKYKVFCDESCHFEYDNADVMVLGAIACPEEGVEGIVRKIKTLRYQYNYKAELKWPKLHGKQLGFYKALIDLFLEADVLRFKAIVADKKSLASGQFNKSSYEDFYCTIRDVRLYLWAYQDDFVVILQKIGRNGAFLVTSFYIDQAHKRQDYHKRHRDYVSHADEGLVGCEWF